MKELNINECKMVSGAGAWDDFWHGVGNAIGTFVADMAYNDQAQSVHQAGAEGNDQAVRDDNPNDPLL